MPKIITAYLEGEVKQLNELERGQRGLTCCTCNDRLVVKDGQGRNITKEGRRNAKKEKHLSHTGNSKCHGEGPAHYTVKTWFYNMTKAMLNDPSLLKGRNMHGQVSYQCTDRDHQWSDSGFPFIPAPGELEKSGTHEFPSLTPDGHIFDLMENLAEVQIEASLPGATRADVAGFDGEGNILWAVEIKRSTLSPKATAAAERYKYPLLVIDITDIPKPPPLRSWEETKDFWLYDDNYKRGFLPHASSESKNLTCVKREMQMDPGTYSGTRPHIILGDEEYTLHRCSSEDPEYHCPDGVYVITNGIDWFDMYLTKEHHEQSHRPLPRDEMEKLLTAAQEAGFQPQNRRKHQDDE